MAPILAGSDSYPTALSSSLSPNYGSLFQQGMHVCVWDMGACVHMCLHMFVYVTGQRETEMLIWEPEPQMAGVWGTETAPRS